MDIRDCECGGFLKVTYTGQKIWGIYRIRTCNKCGKKIRTAEKYQEPELTLAINQHQADRRNEHAKEYYWDHKDARLKYNHEYYKKNRNYYIQKSRERYRRICEEKRKQEENK